MKTIFLHGLGQTGKSFDKTIEFMGINDALTPELFSLTNDKHDFDSLCRATFEYLDNIDGELNICGLSLGAVLALKYAAERPERVASLALIAAQYKPPKILLRLQDLLFVLMPEKNFEGVGLSKSDFRTLCRSMADIDLTGEVSRITCPTLLIIGENDKPNLGASKKLARLINGARLSVVKNSGHEVNLDVPEALAKLLSEFTD